MKPQRPIAVVLAALLVCNGCPMTSARNRRPVLGTIKVMGPNARIDDTRAYTGMELHDGDTVTTGVGSRVLVELAGVGTVLIDENTDPTFKKEEAAAVDPAVRKSFPAAQCAISIFLGSGQAAIEAATNATCKAVLGGGVFKALLKTKVNAQATADQAVLTVLDGKLALESPKEMPVPRAQQVVLAAGRVVKVRTLSEADLAAVAAWTEAFVADPPPSHIPTWLKVAGIGVALAAIGALVYVLTKREPGPTPQPHKHTTTTIAVRTPAPIPPRSPSTTVVTRPAPPRSTTSTTLSPIL